MFPSKANVEGSDIIVTDYRNGGRTVDNNPFVLSILFALSLYAILVTILVLPERRLMILYTWRGQMHVRFKWNSKYFDQKTFEDIDAKAVEYLKDFVEAGSVPSS